MEWAANLLTSISKFGQRPGWLLLIAGSAVLVLDQWRPIPAASLPQPWPTIALVAAVVGATILLICLVEAISSRMARASARQSQSEATERQLGIYRQEAIQNIEILDEQELLALMWILREGKQRFSARINYTVGASLVNKCILGNGSTVSDDIWVVIDSVWQKRDELLKRFERVPHLSRAPWDNRI